MNAAPHPPAPKGPASLSRLPPGESLGRRSLLDPRGPFGGGFAAAALVAAAAWPPSRRVASRFLRPGRGTTSWSRVLPASAKSIGGCGDRQARAGGDGGPERLRSGRVSPRPGPGAPGRSARLEEEGEARAEQPRGRSAHSEPEPGGVRAGGLAAALRSRPSVPAIRFLPHAPRAARAWRRPRL